MSDVPGASADATRFETTVPASPGAAEAHGDGHGKRPVPILTVIICALAVVSAVAAIAVLTHRPYHLTAVSPLRGTVFQLRSGQCINLPQNGTAVAHAVPCAQSHDAEIYGTFRVAGHQWPGDVVLSEQAQQDCQGRLSGYLSQLSPSNVAEFYVYPDRSAWAAGGHSVICEIRGTQGKLTGFVRTPGS